MGAGNCAVCGREITQPQGAGRRRVTCSAACRQKAYRARAKARNPKPRAWQFCAWCGKGFRRGHGFGPAPRFCSARCLRYAKAQRVRLVQGGVLTYLKQHQPSLHAWALDRLLAGQPVPVCPVCRMVFRDVKPTGRPRIYCSDKCKREAHALRWSNCPVCGKPFDRMDARGRLTRSVCSAACGNLRRKRKMRGRPGPKGPDVHSRTPWWEVADSFHDVRE